MVGDAYQAVSFWLRGRDCRLIYNYLCLFFFFKQKTAYEMRISDWSSDVCSSDLDDQRRHAQHHGDQADAGDEEDESLPLAGQQVTPGDHAFVSGQNHDGANGLSMGTGSPSSMLSTDGKHCRIVAAEPQPRGENHMSRK